MRQLLIAGALLFVTATGALALPTIPQLGEHHKLTHDLMIQAPAPEEPLLHTPILGGFMTLGELLYSLSNEAVEHAYKIKELERKVEGMQKQITVLHAKKADKAGAK